MPTSSALEAHGISWAEAKLTVNAANRETMKKERLLRVYISMGCSLR
jgi:hypothetical protein